MFLMGFFRHKVKDKHLSLLLMSFLLTYKYQSILKTSLFISTRNFLRISVFLLNSTVLYTTIKRQTAGLYFLETSCFKN